MSTSLWVILMMVVSVLFQNDFHINICIYWRERDREIQWKCVFNYHDYTNGWDAYIIVSFNSCMIDFLLCFFMYRIFYFRKTQFMICSVYTRFPVDFNEWFWTVNGARWLFFSAKTFYLFPNFCFSSWLIGGGVIQWFNVPLTCLSVMCDTIQKQCSKCSNGIFKIQFDEWLKYEVDHLNMCWVRGAVASLFQFIVFVSQYLRPFTQTDILLFYLIGIKWPRSPYSLHQMHSCNSKQTQGQWPPHWLLCYFKAEVHLPPSRQAHTACSPQSSHSDRNVAWEQRFVWYMMHTTHNVNICFFTQ